MCVFLVVKQQCLFCESQVRETHKRHPFVFANLTEDSGFLWSNQEKMTLRVKGNDSTSRDLMLMLTSSHLDLLDVGSWKLSVGRFGMLQRGVKPFLFSVDRWRTKNRATDKPNSCVNAQQRTAEQVDSQDHCHPTKQEVACSPPR
jgi:hypothetical protein